MKTYDPVSGVCLKYRTQKQQEVGRLIGVGGLTTIAHIMAGTEKGVTAVDTAKSEIKDGREGGIDAEVKDEEAVDDGDAKPEEKPASHGKKKSVSFAAGVEVHKVPPQQQSGSGGGGGGKKKKKGKGR